MDRRLTSSARVVEIDFRKYPDTRHWQFATEYLGEDEHGIWLGGRAGNPAQKGWATPVTFGHDFVKLIVPDGWWTAIWNTRGGISVYVDIVMPARWDGDRVTLLDLDLDVIISSDGSVKIDDEDEFAEHQVSLGYTLEMIEGAEQATAEIVAAIEADAEPFGSVAAGWLAEWASR